MHRSGESHSPVAPPPTYVDTHTIHASRVHSPVRLDSSPYAEMDRIPFTSPPPRLAGYAPSSPYEAVPRPVSPYRLPPQYHSPFGPLHPPPLSSNLLPLSSSYNYPILSYP